MNVLKNKESCVKCMLFLLYLLYIYYFYYCFCVLDFSDCLNAETVVLLMTDGFGVFHNRMVLGKKEFWYVSVRAKGRLECSVLV